MLSCMKIKLFFLNKLYIWILPFLFSHVAWSNEEGLEDKNWGNGLYPTLNQCIPELKSKMTSSSGYQVETFYKRPGICGILMRQMGKLMGLTHNFMASLDHDPFYVYDIERWCKTYFEYPQECVIGFHELKNDNDPCANAIEDWVSCRNDYNLIIASMEKYDSLSLSRPFRYFSVALLHMRV